jgi:hypothetical protein
MVRGVSDAHGLLLLGLGSESGATGFGPTAAAASVILSTGYDGEASLPRMLRSRGSETLGRNRMVSFKERHRHLPQRGSAGRRRLRAAALGLARLKKMGGLRGWAREPGSSSPFASLRLCTR